MEFLGSISHYFFNATSCVAKSEQNVNLTAQITEDRDWSLKLLKNVISVQNLYNFTESVTKLQKM